MSTPLYRRIADGLRAEIVAGRLAPGDAVPTEHELCARHGVSRHTAREALRILTEAGLVSRRRGVGSMVIGPGAPAFVQPIGSVSEILQYARDVALEVEAWRPAPPPARLGLPSDAAFQQLTGVRRTGTGAILALTDVWVRADLAPARTELDALSGALLEWIEAHRGVRAALVRQTLDAVVLGPADAARFGLPQPAAGLSIRRTYLEADGAVIQHSQSLHPEGRFTYAIDLART